MNVSPYRSCTEGRKISGVIFAANYASPDLPYLRADDNNPPTTNPFNPNIQQVLSEGTPNDTSLIMVTTLMKQIMGNWNPPAT